jgi:hypothetical protein
MVHGMRLDFSSTVHRTETERWREELSSPRPAKSRKICPDLTALWVYCVAFARPDESHHGHLSHPTPQSEVAHCPRRVHHLMMYCRGIRVSRKASCGCRSKRKHNEQSGSARARPELNQVSKKELLFCVCLRHTLCTSLARIPCGSTTVL